MGADGSRASFCASIDRSPACPSVPANLGPGNESALTDLLSEASNVHSSSEDTATWERRLRAQVSALLEDERRRHEEATAALRRGVEGLAAVQRSQLQELEVGTKTLEQRFDTAETAGRSDVAALRKQIALVRAGSMFDNSELSSLNV